MTWENGWIIGQKVIDGLEKLRFSATKAQIFGSPRLIRASAACFITESLREEKERGGARAGSRGEKWGHKKGSAADCARTPFLSPMGVGLSDGTGACR